MCAMVDLKPDGTPERSMNPVATVGDKAR
jgi:hypothetical protein